VSTASALARDLRLQEALWERSETWTGWRSPLATPSGISG